MTPQATRRRWVGIALRVVVVGLSILIAVELLGRIDFSKVWAAMTTLSWRDVFVLLLLLAVLRTLNAVPIDLFIPGLRLPRAVLNDSSAYLVSTVSPPPSDMVLRYSMFKSWDLDVTAAFAGVALNSVLFYVIRFTAPIVGIGVLLVAADVGSTVLVTSSLCALIGVAILGILIAVMRAERVAATVGRTGGRVAHRFKPDDVDPEEWSAKLVAFRGNVGQQLRRTWPGASTAMFGMVILDGTVLLVALRSVGVSSSAIPTLLFYGAFFVGYPLTALPFAGLGVYDALLYAMAIDRVGETYSSSVLAALVIWRITTVLLPLLIGVVAYGLWRRTSARAGRLVEAPLAGSDP